MNHASNRWRVMAVVLLCAWFSAATMLVPWPPVLVDLFASKGIAIPSEAIWIRWLGKLALIFGGSLGALLWLRGSRWAVPILILCSVLYLGYWMSEYLFSPGQISEVVSAVARQISNAELLRKLVILQHQVILPVIHLVFLVLAAVRRWSTPAARGA